MKTDVRKRFGWIVRASSAAFLFAVTANAQAPPATSGNAETARDKAKEKVQAAQENRQEARKEVRDVREGARDATHENRRETRNAREHADDQVRDTRRSSGDKIGDAREGARDTARENRQENRDTREDARDSNRDNRQVLREARREAFAARREFIAERIRSGDLGVWLRKAADRLMVTDVAGSGAITQTGLKEGDEIVSVDGHAVGSERDFVDFLFGKNNHQPVKVVIKRSGQEQTIMINPQPFIAEHEASDNRLQDFGLIIDESNPAHVKIQAVVPRSPAFYAGMRAGDLITSFNGQRIMAAADFAKSLANKIGERIAVEVNRNNQTRQLDIEVPGEQQTDQARTALKPTLPNTTAPQGTQPRTATPNQPRLNPPR